MSTEKREYNVILIMTDQHRGDCLGCAGHPVVETPHLDSLANDGVNFTNAYSAVPSCIPARAILMTGQTAWNTGCLGMGGGQANMRTDYAHTLPATLAENGYHTQLVGKMHFHPPRALNGFHGTVLDEHAKDTDYEQFFERNAPAGVHMREHLREWNSMICRPFFLPEYLHPTNWTAREAVNFVERRDPTKPFFLCNSYIRPHSPYDPPQYYWDMYERKEIPQPAVGEWASIHEGHDNERSASAWHGKKTESEIRQARIGYYACISHVDNQIGNVITYLKSKGLYANSLIIFTSDHGDMMGDHHMWRKTYAYEGSVKIPFIVKFPNDVKQPKNVTCDKPVELRDVMATIMDVCGIDVPKTVDGCSVIDAVNGKPWRDYLHGEHCTCYSTDEEIQYVTDGKRKYIWFPRTGREQYFNLETDPCEITSLMDDPAYTAEIEVWRARLVSDLRSRPGLVEGGELIVQDGPIISPYRDRPRVDADC